MASFETIYSASICLKGADCKGSLPAERTRGVRVVTLGCPISENVAGVDYHQYLGLFDALGQINAWGHRPDHWPPTWHSTNPVLPPAMAVGEITSESVRN